MTSSVPFLRGDQAGPGVDDALAPSRSLVRMNDGAAESLVVALVMVVLHVFLDR